MGMTEVDFTSASYGDSWLTQSVCDPRFLDKSRGMGPCARAQLRTRQGRPKHLILDPITMQVVAVGVEPALGAFDMVADTADDAPEPG
jgi:hypothetical protein